MAIFEKPTNQDEFIGPQMPTSVAWGRKIEEVMDNPLFRFGAGMAAAPVGATFGQQLGAGMKSYDVQRQRQLAAQKAAAESIRQQQKAAIEEEERLRKIRIEEGDFALRKQKFNLDVKKHQLDEQKVDYDQLSDAQKLQLQKDEYEYRKLQDQYNRVQEADDMKNKEFKTALDLRDDYDKRSDSFKAAKNAYQKMIDTFKMIQEDKNNAELMITLIYDLNKILDPGSMVKESELEMHAKGGIFVWLSNQLSKAKSGAPIDIDQAKKIMDAGKSQYLALANEQQLREANYQKLFYNRFPDAKAKGMDVNDYIPSYYTLDFKPSPGAKLEFTTPGKSGTQTSKTGSQSGPAQDLEGLKNKYGGQ